MTRSDLSLTCIVLKQPKGYTALCVDVDVASEGATPAKAKQMLREALEIYLDTAFENNLPYLRPVSRDQDPRYISPETVIETFSLRVDLAVQVHA